MRLVSFLAYIGLVIGAIGMLAGQFFGQAKGFNLGVFMAGLGFGIAGADALITRRMPFRPSDDVYENYANLPAIIIGAMVFAVGAAMIGAAYLLDNEQWHSTLNYLTRRPAPVIAAGGLFLVGSGVLMMLNPQGRSSWAWRILVYFPRSLIGLVVITAGLAVIGVAAWDWFEPGAFSRASRQLSALLSYIAPHRP
jgi:uncharacterized membrane protein YidH (DUF202 family)